MIKLKTTQLFLCVFFCVIASTFSFRSNFVKFCPQRYGSRALTALVKAPQFEPIRGKTITRNVRLPGVLLCKNDVNDEAVRKRGKWSDDEMARLRELVTAHEQKIPSPNKEKMWREIGLEMNRSHHGCSSQYHSHIRESPPRYRNRAWKKWTKDQVEELFKEVELQKKYSSGNHENFWQDLSGRINRTTDSCISKYYKSGGKMIEHLLKLPNLFRYLTNRRSKRNSHQSRTHRQSEGGQRWR